LTNATPPSSLHAWGGGVGFRMKTIWNVLGAVVVVASTGCCAVGEGPSSRERALARGSANASSSNASEVARATPASKPTPTLAQAPDATPAPSVLISIEANDEPIRDVIDTIARASGQNIVCDPSVTGRCTIALRKLPWREAVFFIAAQNGCDVNELRNGVLYAVDEPKVTLTTH